jgi:hypothetical protein
MKNIYTKITGCFGGGDNDTSEDFCESLEELAGKCYEMGSLGICVIASVEQITEEEYKKGVNKL